MTSEDDGSARLGLVLYPATGADVQRLMSFYADGLGLAVAFTDGERFAGLVAGGVMFAIAGPTEAVAGPVPAAAFRVDDIAARVDRLCAAGATVIRPIETGEHESRAVLQDPAGNPFVVYVPIASLAG